MPGTAPSSRSVLGPRLFPYRELSHLHVNLKINGDSETWKNKIDVDVPLGKKLLGHELRTGGYFSRQELYGDIKDGLNTDHIYEIHGRVVLDFLGKLWKVQWIGIGGSYLWGSNFTGWAYRGGHRFPVLTVLRGPTGHSYERRIRQGRFDCPPKP